MKRFLKIITILFSLLVSLSFPQQSGWEIIPSGTTVELNSIHFYDYETGYACGNTGVVIKSVDSGKTWQTLQSPVSQNFNDLFMFDQNTILAVGDSGTMVFSDDGGANWVVGPYYITEDYFSVSFSGGEGICGGSSQTILYGTYTGTSLYFATAQIGLFGGGFWGAYMLSPQIGFVAGENSIFQSLFGRTTDSGVNWEFVSFYLNGNEGRATGVDFTDQLIGFVSAWVWDGRGAISKTTDNGNNWATTFFNNPLWGIDFPISGASQVGYCVGDSGTIVKTYDAGENWQEQISGTSEKLNKVYFIDLDFGFIVGDNGLILRTITGGEPITTKKDDDLLVKEFILHQNYPNPFNPTTKIKYQIPGLNFVTLKVYDVLGKEVATLVNEEKSAGTYEVKFNPASGIQNPASGIYFYQLKAGSFIQTKKMILLK